MMLRRSHNNSSSLDICFAGLGSWISLWWQSYDDDGDDEGRGVKPDQHWYGGDEHDEEYEYHRVDGGDEGNGDDDGAGGGVKPDQHWDGGDEHDKVAGGEHVSRDREWYWKWEGLG